MVKLSFSIPRASCATRAPAPASCATPAKSSLRRVRRCSKVLCCAEWTVWATAEALSAEVVFVGEGPARNCLIQECGDEEEVDVLEDAMLGQWRRLVTLGERNQEGLNSLSGFQAANLC